jgi:hypothetical protein
MVLLQKLLSGFASLGQGALKTAVYEVKDFWVLHPKMIPYRSDNSFFLRDILTIEEELHMNDRLALDSIIFDALGLTQGERDAIYEAVIQLVEARLKKAESLNPRPARRSAGLQDLHVEEEP